MKLLKISFAILCYLIGFASIIYYMDFFTGFLVPKSINSGNPRSLLEAVTIDLALIALFALQHTIMARTGFKKWFNSKFTASLSRSFYVLFSSIFLGLIIFLWQPIPLVIYDLSGSIAGIILLCLYYIGWSIGLLSSFEIDHLELFGVKQAVNPNKKWKYKLKALFFYRVVRHPILLGWLLIHWMTPVLTVGHLIFAVSITIYIFIALKFEERDLVEQFGNKYLEYKKVTPKLNPLVYPFKQKPFILKAINSVVIIAFVVLLGYWIYFFNWVSEEMNKMKSNDPSIWKEDISYLAAHNQLQNTDHSAVLFVGSSSFRFWDHMKEDLHPIKVINNGFGGAKIEDIIYYIEDLIFSYNPKKIVFFLGTNDLNGSDNDKSPEEIINLYDQLIKRIHKKLPQCDIFILPITPTIARWEVWQQVEKINEKLIQRSESMDQVTFINCQNFFLTPQEKPDWKYYKWDGIHLNRLGYQVWSNAIKNHLLYNN